MQGSANLISSLLPLVALFAIFYFLVIRPQQNQAKKHKEMLSALKKGDKVITNKDFVANFDKLDATVKGDALANAIVAVKHGSKKNPWEIDAISGATISSKAIAKGLNGSAQDVLPKVVPLLSQMEGAQP